MRKTWLFWLVILTLTALLALVIFNQSIPNTYLIDPITKIVWLFMAIINAVNQNVFWSIVIIAAVIVAFFFIPTQADEFPDDTNSRNLSIQEGYRYWDNLFKKASTSLNAFAHLRQRLIGLLKAVDGMKGLNRPVDVVNPNNSTIYWFRTQIKKFQIFTGRKRINDLPLDDQIKESIDQFLRSLEETLEIMNN